MDLSRFWNAFFFSTRPRGVLGPMSTPPIPGARCPLVPLAGRLLWLFIGKIKKNRKVSEIIESILPHQKNKSRGVARVFLADPRDSIIYGKGCGARGQSGVQKSKSVFISYTRPRATLGATPTPPMSGSLVPIVPKPGADASALERFARFCLILDILID